METREYHSRDKTTWAEGPWKAEPDKIQFEDCNTGLPCLIVRNAGGALCGYVGVPTGHPAHGKHYDDVNALVHGGLTFASPCTKNGNEATSICHVPAPGESDDVWWLGFDCAHSGDTCPAAEARALEVLGYEISDMFTSGKPNKYRTVNYVKRHIAKLALQLHDM